MLIKSLVIYCFFACALAWLAPERCAQGKRSGRALSETIHAGVTPSIEEIAAEQHELLKKRYNSYQFYGIPIRCNCYGNHCLNPAIYAPYNCTFHTYNPRLITSVACSSDVDCKLTRTVSTEDTYTASEEYNWGVTVSSKFGIPDVFEVGGEVSTGGTYTCTYTKGRTTAHAVECSTSSHKSGHLQLYNVKTDMECDFGTKILELDHRDNKTADYSENGDFTASELDEIHNSATMYCKPLYYKRFMIDLSKISSRVLQKILIMFPLFNPYTDMVNTYDGTLFVTYYKINATVHEYRKIIPFTNESGDSENQYACVLTQF